MMKNKTLQSVFICSRHLGCIIKWPDNDIKQLSFITSIFYCLTY